MFFVCLFRFFALRWLARAVCCPHTFFLVYFGEVYSAFYQNKVSLWLFVYLWVVHQWLWKLIETYKSGKGFLCSLFTYHLISSSVLLPSSLTAEFLILRTGFICFYWWWLLSAESFVEWTDLSLPLYCFYYLYYIVTFCSFYFYRPWYKWKYWRLFESPYLNVVHSRFCHRTLYGHLAYTCRSRDRKKPFIRKCAW